MADPAEIASYIEFLASQDASFVTSAVLTAEGGASIVDIAMLGFSKRWVSKEPARPVRNMAADPINIC